MWGYPQVRKEPQDVVLAVVQAFQQHPARRLLGVRAGDAAYAGQAGQHAVAEQPQVRGGVLAGNGVQALLAGSIGGVDQGAQGICDLAEPDRGGVGWAASSMSLSRWAQQSWWMTPGSLS